MNRPEQSPSEPKWPSHESLAKQVAEICGPASAAALALKEMEERRAKGESVGVFHYGRSWFVAPTTEKQS